MDKIRTIAANHTFGQQRTVFAEKCAEAIQVVCKLERAADQSAEKYGRDNDRTHLSGEYKDDDEQEVPSDASDDGV